MQKVTMSPHMDEPRYKQTMVKVDKAGFTYEMLPRYFGDGGFIEYVKKLKKIKI